MIQAINRLNRKINLFFWISFFFTFLYITFAFPSLSYKAEIYAELGTNFYPAARFETLWENIWKTDAGYLPWLQRFISIIVIKVFGINDIFPYVCQFIGIGFISFFCSFINILELKKIIPDDIVRFFISILLGFGIFSSYEEFTFINFSYYGIFFIVLCFFINKEKLQIFPYLLLLFLSVLVVNAKAYFVVSAPLFGLHLIYSIAKKRKKEVSFALSVLAAILTQAYTVIKYRANFRTDSTIKAMKFEEIPMSIFNYICSTLLKILEIPIEYRYLLIPIVILICVLLHYNFKKKNYSLFSFLFICVTLSVGSLTISLISIPTFVWSKIFYLPPIGIHRHYFLSNYLLWIGLIALFFSLKMRSKIQRYICLFLLIVISSYHGFKVMTDRDIFLNPHYSHSQWKYYKQLLSYNDYCIPINPSPWQMAKDCIEIEKSLVEKSNLRAIIWEKKLQNFNRVDQIKSVIAFDSSNNILGNAYLLNNYDNPSFNYFLFEKRVMPNTLKYYNYNNQEVSVKDKKIKFYGALK